MTPLLFLAISLSSALQQSATTTSSQRGFLPIVVATTEKPTDMDQALPAVTTPSALKKLAPKGYVFLPFQSFTLAYPENTFGLRDAHRQAALLATSLQAWRQGKKTIDVASLPDEQQRHVRSMFGMSQTAEAKDAAVNPNLRLVLEVHTSLHLNLGTQEADVELDPKRPIVLKEDSEYVTRPVAEDAARPSRGVEDKVANGLSSLTFLFPSDGVAPQKHIEWANEAGEALRLLCQEAAEAIKGPQAALIGALMADDPGNYGKWSADRMPRFSDLDRTKRHDAEQYFYACFGRKMFRSTDASASFLMNARTTSYRSEIWLMANYVTGTGPGYAVVASPGICLSWPVHP